jgi:hypothetical protein
MSIHYKTTKIMEEWIANRERPYEIMRDDYLLGQRQVRESTKASSHSEASEVPQSTIAKEGRSKESTSAEAKTGETT